MIELKDLDMKLKGLPSDIMRGIHIPNYRQVLAENVGRLRNQNPDIQKKCYSLANRLLENKSNSMRLEDDEFNFIYKCQTANPANFFPFYNSQVTLYLEGSKH